MIDGFKKRTKPFFFIKIYPSFYFWKVPIVWCLLGDRWRDIYSERGLLSISPSGSQWMPTLAPLCKLVRDELIGWVSIARLRFSALCINLTAWFSSHGLLQVTHLLYPGSPIVLTCLLITTWQLVKAHGVTRDAPKIHGICYITQGESNSPVKVCLSILQTIIPPEVPSNLLNILFRCGIKPYTCK